VGENLLKVNGNKLKVRVTDTDKNGSIKFDDVVLMYTQRPERRATTTDHAGVARRLRESQATL
jgi:hypothetical protein